MNTPLRAQQTLARPVSVAGFGFWSGRDVTVEFRPAAVAAGIVFVRRDVSPATRIPARVGRRIETPRRTTLTDGQHNVEMVEHVLAALYGLHIDNCEIWVDQPEMPGCDGSSLPFVEALLGAGIVTQPAPVSRLVVTEPLRVGDDDQWVEARPARGPRLALDYRLDYGPRHVISRQRRTLKFSRETFVAELAAARTFVTQQEADWLRSRGLAARVTARDVLVFGEAGPLDNELRFEDECVRHKMLDLVGDLALIGCDLVGSIRAFRSGHRLNAELAAALMQEARREDAARNVA